jgi:putative drug exporter of the RND superfamily
VAAQGLELTRRLARERDVSEVRSYWNGGAAPLRSRDGRQALVLARITTGDERLAARADQLAAAFDSDRGAARVQVGGAGRFSAEVQGQVERDLARAEGIAVPITLVLLVVVFSSAVAGALPLAVGGLAIIGTLLVLRVLAGLTDVSIYSLNLTTALGLGLAIDYSLFIVSRYREELRAESQSRQSRHSRPASDPGADPGPTRRRPNGACRVAVAWLGCVRPAVHSRPPGAL